MEANQDNRQRVLAQWELLNRLAQRRFPDPNMADEALLYVLGKLEENDWARIRQFQGQARFDTYLTHVAVRLLEDFARHKFGRRRTPDWIKTQGTLWEQIFQLLCLERRQVSEVVEILRQAVPGGREPQPIREAAAVIRSRVTDCGAPPPSSLEQPWPEQGEPFEALESRQRQAHERSPEDLQAAAQQAALLEHLRRIVFADDPAAADSELPQAVQRLQTALSLSDEERLLLRMVFQENMKVVEAGRLLGLEANQVHGRLRRLLQKIHEALQAAGLEEALRLMLDDSEWL